MPFIHSRHHRRAADTLRRLHARIATGVGAVVLGLAAIAFARLGDLVQLLFAALAANVPWAPLLLTPATFALVVWWTRTRAPAAGGSGIPQIMAAARQPDGAETAPLVSLRTAGAKVVMTLLMLGCGGSTGREGPTVQLGAAITVAAHRLLRVPLTAGVLIAGGAAGVAAAFNTPLGGVAFAIEELAAAYEQKVALLVMAAVMVAGLVSLGVAGDYIYFGAMRQTLPVHAVLLVAPVAGVVGGTLGGLFARTLLGWSAPRHGWFVALRRHPVLVAGLCGLLVAAVGIATDGLTFGTGYAATRALVEANGAPMWFGPAKLLATLATALSGAPGGIFAPSLAVGAGVGNIVAALFPGQPAGAIVLLGMIGYFVGVVRAPLTAVIIITETTASRGMIVPLFVTALVADVASSLVCREKLYHGLSRAFSPPKRSVSIDPVADLP